ncbi:MAG TPA: aspartyl/asparaginyl beta-hydroxylase domain-containing protein [Solirubrobacteraceae bacterium]
MEPELERDETADALISFLRSEGAGRRTHAGERTLLDHLVGVYEVVRRWNQPLVVQHAALIHSVYGTDVYHQQLLAVSRRAEVAEIAGESAERLAYLFCFTPRDPLFAGTYRWARTAGPEPLVAGAPDGQPATRAQLDQLVLLHMANLAEQAQSPDGSPSRWLVRIRKLAELVIDSDAVTLPVFLAALASFSESDEQSTLSAYRAGLGAGDEPEVMGNRLALAAATCPVVAEPCIWQSYVARLRGSGEEARAWARRGRRRLLDLGTTWDKRLSFDEWLQLAEALQRTTGQHAGATGAGISDPRTLFAAAVGGELDQSVRASPTALAASAKAGRERFHRYVEAFAEIGGTIRRPVYPDLGSQPWFNPSEFPLARCLEDNYDVVRDEILALESSRFHRESEQIKRSGEWDVLFLYERGRRHDEVCERCPATTRAIESHPTMRTAAGLIYVSRMRPGTHIEAHRGPTNLRVRCHLGVAVPDGDCAIRVGDRIERWHEGRCLVFDDHFEHEAWNHTDADRVVLIVDLWHPGLSGTEVRLLEGLLTYTYSYARQLNRYWSSNAATRMANDPSAQSRG